MSDTITMAAQDINKLTQKQAILIVDDEMLIRRMCRSVFEQEGFEVIEASTGEEALEIIKARPVCLVLADVVMPGISGLELLKKIKSFNPEIEIIIMTGFSTVETAVEALKDGAADFLTKPFDSISILKKSVAKVLEKQALSKLTQDLTENLRKKNETMSWLFSVTSRIGEIRNHNQLIDFVCQTLMEAVPVSGLAICVLNERLHKTCHLVFRGGEAEKDRWHDHLLNRVTGFTPDSNQVDDVEVFIVGIQSEETFAPGGDEMLIELEKIREYTGTVFLLAPQGHVYTGDDKNLVNSICSQFNMACERLRLRYAEERARIGRIIEVLADGVIVMDEKFRPSLANGAALQMFGLKSLDDMQNDPRLGVIFSKIKAGGQKVRHFNVAVLKPERTNLALDSAPVFDSQGKVTGHVVSIANVTDVKNEGRRRLEFVSVISNKLPTVTEEIIQALKEQDGLLSRDVEKPLQEMQRQSRRLWSFSLIEAGPLRLDRIRVKIPVMIQGIIDLLIFTVEDEGPGKTDMDEDIVFDVSRQLVEFENFNVAEIGVGLPMAKRIVEAHGGKIWLLHDEQKKRSGIGFSLRKWF